MPAPRRIVLSAGELSGDLHAAHLVRVLRERYPDAVIAGMAGVHCARAGMEVLFDHRGYAVIGFTGVLAALPRFADLERRMHRLIDGADLFIAVDYPGLNLRLCGYARRRRVPVLYYIAPQVWAWGEGRVARLRRDVSRMAVILPFEEEYFRHRRVHAEFVGHPFVVDHELRPARLASARTALALLPGSRVGEVKAMLPVLVAAVAEVRRTHPKVPVVIGKSPMVERRLYQHLLAHAPDGIELDEDAVAVLNQARAALVASGTATLQAALLETPLAVVYRTSRVNYAIARRVVRIPHVGLVNVLLEDEVAPELVQSRATPQAIAAAAVRLLDDEPYRAAMQARFRTLRAVLGKGRGCERVAELADELLA